MSKPAKIAFIGAGSTVFMKNIVGDILQREALKNSHIALMDINLQRLEESALVVQKLVSGLNVEATFSTHPDQREALEEADFVVVAFQIGGYEPCTVTDFEVPKKFGLHQTIADTLGIGGIMRGLRTVPYLWSVCEDMLDVCPQGLMLQYVNPMAINTWAITARYPTIRQVGLCHSVQHTANELSRDLKIPLDRIRYQSAGINHVAFFLQFEERLPDGSYRDLYPDLKRGYEQGIYPRPENSLNPRCPNKVRYEVMKRLGYFCTESSEHLAEYVPWFIKNGREDLIERFGIPLDEYPKRCVEQIEQWKSQLEEFISSTDISIPNSVEYASEIINSVWTGRPSVIYGNVPNKGSMPALPEGCAVEVPCVVDGNGIQPTIIDDLPPQLMALMRTNINVQQLTVRALLEERRDHIYHAAMMDPHTAAELDIEQIWAMVDELIKVHGAWLPRWVHDQ
ncbi:MAG: alpha-glucosidase/alpha-galactosidase [Arenicellales bacterium]|jgi:alpha-galactosidase|nr:alpha-glucosidase/alpha-galactosidase [Pseudomonadales bacterium]MDP7452759.1 alpha-glucosidase/alpha-galactosidase [Arenicellales bacterium]|tara:strand:+ start:901 stop:2259 length:1359 start_codon:yes stop_codon:yes gene_type:complete